ncbi:MAG: hypothetical protein H6822_10300 [Planctomycetaceae bacterium]|nr:hypothetical protein [Planctomycetaceae bacterium]
MLTEFAFTPSIFDEDAHEDKEAWREQLKELGRNLFPRVSACPVVVSDLYAGSWNQVADQTVKRIKDQRARLLCEGILQKMRETLVSRPVCGDWPDEDIAWGREAIASDKAESIERIVANAATKNALLEEYKLIRSLEEVEEGGFWRGIVSDASPKMIIKDQIELLKKLWMHSEWIALINPFSCGNEQDFALHLISEAFGRSSDFGRPHFELHGQDDKKWMNIVNQVKSRLSVGQTVYMYHWPKLLDRIILAGSYSRESDGTKKKTVRWGVSMSHVAHGNEPSAPPTEWKLLRTEPLDYWFRKHVKEDAAGKPTPIPITPVTV